MTCTTACHRPHGRQAHCGVCHRTFSVVRNFDDHRKAGDCADPAGLGMSEKNQVWAMWGSASDRQWWSDLP